jgi:hypothetical protein
MPVTLYSQSANSALSADSPRGRQGGMTLSSVEHEQYPKRLAATNQIEVMRALAFQAGCVEPFDETITEAHGPRQMEVGSFPSHHYFPSVQLVLTKIKC